MPESAGRSITHTLHELRTATSSADDLEAARRIDAVANRVFLDPLLSGSYPEDLQADTAALTDWSFVHDGDLAAITATPISVLGINYYTPTVVRAATPGASPAGPSFYPGAESVEVVPQPGSTTAMGWSIDETGLYDLLRRLADNYPGLPIAITENGSAWDDEVVDGAVHDAQRVDYLQRHLRAAYRALADGVPLTGYFAWSLMDNFEWSHGYAKRFGIVHVDYDTQQRTPKDSFAVYRDIVARNGLPT